VTVARTQRLYLSVCLSVGPQPYVCLSDRLSVHPSACLSACLPACLLTCDYGKQLTRVLCLRGCVRRCQVAACEGEMGHFMKVSRGNTTVLKAGFSIGTAMTVLRVKDADDDSDEGAFAALVSS
jgi:hypothetical protein